MRHNIHVIRALLLALLAFADTPAPPAIAPHGVVNAASLLSEALGGAVAPGSRFTINGVRLGPSAAVRGSERDPATELGGVTVRFRQGAKSVDAPLFAVSATRVEALAPPAMAPGDAELSVSFEGRTSEPYKLMLAADAPGLFAPEAPLDAVPGSTVELRATGVAGQVRLTIGGRPVSVTATSADCCRGVEDLRVVIPADAPQGCAAPIQLLGTGVRASNVVPLTLHAPNQPCHDAIGWFREIVEHSARAGYVVLAHIGFDIPAAPRAHSHYEFDYAASSFGRQEQGRRAFPPLPPMGSCTLFPGKVNLRQYLGMARMPETWASAPEKVPGNRGLDAGSAIEVTGSAGAHTLHRDPRQPEYYSAILGGAPPFAHDPPTKLFLHKGTFRVTSAGGPEVGAFSGSVEIPGAIDWRNRTSIDVVQRASGLSVEWKAANRDDAILIVAANADRQTGESALSLCLAPAADGRFTIPPAALANIPVTTDESGLAASFVILAELPVQRPPQLTARGIDSAMLAYVSAAARLVRFR